MPPPGRPGAVSRLGGPGREKQLGVSPECPEAMPRHFEDIDPDETHDLGGWTVSEAEIVEFAERYDPQPFHVDPAAAEESIYGGLIASGWQTVALTMRTMVEGFLADVESMGARGIDDLRWKLPVRPGDRVETRIRVLETDASGGNPAVGDVRAETVGENGDGEVVVSWVNNFLVRRADPE